jgi:gingipain R
MKNILQLGLFLLISIHLHAQKKSAFTILSDKSYETLVDIQVGDLQQQKVVTPHGEEVIIRVEHGSQLLEKGSPDLPKLSFSLIIPNDKQTEIEVIESDYTDIANIHVAPSKGKIYRDQKPSAIPFEYGEVYSKSAFFPSQTAYGQTPYIVRDYRGQTFHIQPVQYNPVTKVLRVYHHLKVKIKYSGKSQLNSLSAEWRPERIVDEFDQLYQNHFLNYKTTATRYTPLTQQGTMLILCPANYLPEIAPYMKWKEMKGINCYLVNTDTITGGVTENTVRALVNQYYTEKQIAYLLLVGDQPNIPTRNWDGMQFPDLLGPSDNGYAYQLGNDHYPEFIVGRFSGETKADIEVQVKRTLLYEKNPNTTSDWVQKQIGIASDQGPGDDFQMDYEHVRNVMDSNKNQYHYVQNYEMYDGTQGGNDATGNPTSAELLTAINNGVGLLNYTGHGSTEAFTTTGFSNLDVDNLTNTDGKWPFMFVTACLNGNFTQNNCLAEALLRARDANMNPKGAIATLMSTILQSWDPPMQGQDEMNAILRGARPTNVKNTFGALAMNGCMSVNDEYNTATDPDGGNEITDTWTVFGDPTLVVRTKHEGTLTCTHTSEIGRNSTWYSVSCPVNGATVGLYYQGDFLAVSTVNNGVAEFTFPAILNTDSVFITATKQNYVPYMGYTRVIDFPTSVQNIQSDNAWSIYPNPVTEQCRIKNRTGESIQSLSLYDASGKQVFSLQPAQAEITLQLQELATGVYNLELITSSGTYNHKLTKVK